MVKIVADAHIPFLKGVLEPFAQIKYIPGDIITRADIMDADGLIVRTRTKCGKALLEGTQVRFLATATIGIDHIDTAYCEDNGIEWNYSPGCNASSVKQYVASALAHLALEKDITLEGRVIGVIGVGNVGRKIAKLAQDLGMKVLLNDPPRQEIEGQAGFSSLQEIMSASDIITFHVPLNLEGPFRTYHLADRGFFRQLARKPIIINTSRGEVVETEAVKEALSCNLITGFVADVWENEPLPDLGLLMQAAIATPHIAGYSVEGKANGTAACVKAASRFFRFGLDDWSPATLPAPQQPVILHGNKGEIRRETGL